ncbi:MAG: hypothetical protein A2X45_06145 [Lentisphaerae bacterium GWF2_50_93]|nr:MAG: hypothetical protein A2X45_06145 [Lentisphaerae bacterium GWF2_50_93]
MNRRDFLKTSGLGLAAFTLSGYRSFGLEGAVNGRKPNIIFILADDLGLSEISCCGGDHYKTPNIDKLAQTGTRFEYSYSPPPVRPITL